ncbi:hypothetical protein Hanom_Chr00s181740g01832151 [Helianthus anomalus]
MLDLFFDQWDFCGFDMLDAGGDDEKNKNVDFDDDGAARTAKGRFFKPATPLLQPFGYRLI